MRTMNMPGFTAKAALSGANGGDGYIMQLPMTAGTTGEVVPQISFDSCMHKYIHAYATCRLDGWDIDFCSELADATWEAYHCPF